MTTILNDVNAGTLGLLLTRRSGSAKAMKAPGPSPQQLRAILSAAAREAVQQWRFKPYLQSGQAVESESRITVNFTIWTR